MLGLTILEFELSADTNNGRFLSKMNFQKGLNIIRADNSSGKSTCVNAIAHGLGLEAILGPSKNKPFPKSLYEQIFDTKLNGGKSHFVSKSSVTIMVQNSLNQIALIQRDIRGQSNKVTITIGNVVSDFFLGTSGAGVGSYLSDKGFHYWLTNFIGWNLPSVATFDDKEVKLYLECIFPLFFIEQKRGWSEIQANTPNYGIKNVKKTATEFCLAIDTFEYEKKLNIQKNKIEFAKNEWEILQNKAEGIADFNIVKVNNFPPLKISKDPYCVNFSYLENNAYYSIDDQIRALNKRIRKLTSDLESNSPQDEELTAQMSIVSLLLRNIGETQSKVELLLLSNAEVSNKLSILNKDYLQYKQLKKLETVGSKQQDINLSKCPACESDLNDSLGQHRHEMQPMSLQQNIEFLKNQIDFFNANKLNNNQQLNILRSEHKILRTKFNLENDKLSNLRDSFENINGEVTEIIRHKMQAELDLKEVEKLKNNRDDLNAQAERIYSDWIKATKALQLLKAMAAETDKEIIIGQLESLMKANLETFNFNQSALGYITISRQTLRPEQEGYDIVAETSASDYIRVIWSYTLALIELAAKNQEVKHGGFVVFDEPRQHEASKISFTNLIIKSSKLLEDNVQVIFATSHDLNELKEACNGMKVNLISIDDYILKKEVIEVSNEGANPTS